jgi:tRNA(Ile)-lysidine synthase
LRGLARDIGANGILTAHHADDQAETILLHLIRGTGLEGVAAISPKEGGLCRPLLEVTKDDIISYCGINQLEYRIDSSNKETNYLRNKIRLCLVPQLKEYNPRVVEALARTADICRADNEYLENLTCEYLKDLGFGKEKSINFQKLKLLHPALQRRVVRRAFEEISGQQGGLSYHQTGKVLNLTTGKEISLPGRIYARRDYDRLIFSFFSSGNRVTEIEPVKLKIPGQVQIPAIGLIVQAEIRNWPDERFIQTKHSAVFNIAILKNSLFIRTRRKGDRFQPKGLQGTKKLKDFFIDEKVPREERDRIPLLVSGEQIVWVVGQRLSRHFLVTKDDKRAVVIKVKNMDQV